MATVPTPGGPPDPGPPGQARDQAPSADGASGVAGRRPVKYPVLIRFFEVSAIAEACSWAGLLLGMYLKYLGGGNRLVISIFGPLHGLLVVAYVFSVFMAREELGWKGRTAILGLLASIPPFATLYYVRKVPK